MVCDDPAEDELKITDKNYAELLTQSLKQRGFRVACSEPEPGEEGENQFVRRIHERAESHCLEIVVCSQRMVQAYDRSFAAYKIETTNFNYVPLFFFTDESGEANECGSNDLNTPVLLRSVQPCTIHTFPHRVEAEVLSAQDIDTLVDVMVRACDPSISPRLNTVTVKECNCLMEADVLGQM